METLIFLIGLTALIAAVCFLAFLTGWVLTEVLEPIKVKPFNCRPCLTFWLSGVFSGILALCVTPNVINFGLTDQSIVAYYAITGVGLLVGLLQFAYLKSKFNIYD